MLTELHLRNLGVIAEATLPLGPGLNVVTGETGAGKTMVVTGLGLLLGVRGDAGMVRGDADALEVEGRAELSPEHPAAARVIEAGGLLDDELLIVRTVSRNGRSRAWAGGRSVPVGVLAQLGADLVTVHGQSDQARLRDPKEHREVLDHFGAPETDQAAARMAAAYERHHEVSAELRRLAVAQAQRDQRLEELREDLAAVEELAVQPGEEEELRLREERLAHVTGLRLAAQTAHDLLLGDDAADSVAAATALVDQALAALDGAGSHDADLAHVAERVREASLALGDIGAELAAYLLDLEADPRALAATQERRAALSALTRRHGGTSHSLLEWAEHARAEVDELDGLDDRLAELAGQLETARAELVDSATRLSAARRTAASRLAKAIAGELADLAMPKATVEVAVEQRELDAGLPLPDGRRVAFASHGVDDVEIRMAAHPGAPMRSVARTASGGELSRVMLAIEVVTAAAHDTDTTFVFDEVDAGIGGAAALTVGARLARLGERAQVIVVTHLAQVAAYADHHLVVEKTEGTTTVREVVGPDREAELARMLSGMPDSVTAIAHARELLALQK